MDTRCEAPIELLVSENNQRLAFLNIMQALIYKELHSPSGLTIEASEVHGVSFVDLREALWTELEKNTRRIEREKRVQKKLQSKQ